MPESFAGPRACAPHAALVTDPGPCAIELAGPSAGAAEFLNAGERERLALAGQDALEACLRRFAHEDREAFWRAICRCYNRPYNPPEPALPDLARTAIPASIPASVPAPHVIEALQPLVAGAVPDAPLR
ncbi:hypothetical protein [Methylobacterium nonmethylotrophicum]|uniref:Uncharacterized protein n=1 Tax=Methylobacterium nonmethylotrophicum TaxID=1141884 RepID=A0A4Z0NJP0_9HYPH|nr:hypothetical protein [Methylobacterium nonmethylotrophicum]TGD96567.1 hypothetical protein EU555_22655 [Methylobacterium nonmethylotrophicum]